MKRISNRVVTVSIIVLIILVCIPLKALADQTQVQAYGTSALRAQVKNTNTYKYFWSIDAIGKWNGRLNVDTLNNETYRTACDFPVYSVPTGATVDSVTLYLTATIANNQTFTYKMVDFSSSNWNSADQCWNDAGTGTVYKSGIVTNSGQIAIKFKKSVSSDQTFIDAIQNSIASTHMYVGFVSENENADQMLVTSFSAILFVDWTPPIYEVSVKNSFNRGQVVVDDTTRDTGKKFYWKSNSSHKLLAIDRQPFQEANYKTYVNLYQSWTDLEGRTAATKPEKKAIISVTRSGVCIANFLKEYNLTFSNSFGVGPVIVNRCTQSSGYLLKIQQYSTVTFSVDFTSLTYNGWDYTFVNWTADNGTVRTVTSPNIPTDHTNYIANYSKKLRPIAQVNGTTAVVGYGTHPKITWSNTDLAPEVTGYKIFRKFGKTGAISYLTTVNGRNTLQFVDTEVVLIPKAIDPINYYVSAVSGTYESLTTRCAITYFGVMPKTQATGDGTMHELASEELPTSVSLLQNYPNPWNPTTTITFALPTADYVKLVVYDMLGREVKTLVDGNCSAGYHSVEVDGSRLSSGMYFYKLQVGSHSEMKKMQLIK